MRTNRDIRQVLFAFGLLAALVTYGTFSRVPSEQHETSVAHLPGSGRLSRLQRRFQFSPNRITLKKGQPVTLQLTSADVTHGFLLRALKIDTDIPPGKTTEITVTPQVAGTFKAICHHYCGLGHGNVKMTVVVQ